ncbi:MAG: thrombospondin type 3 repeat-containing protein [Patescibacteria group bacterium]
MHIPEKYLKYLPSKKFILIISVGVVLAVIIFIIFFMSSSGENFITGDKKATALKVENQTVADLIQKDTDGDGIPDWEEALWGTDPNKKITFNDMPDVTYIENKKKELKIEQSVSVDTTNLTETEKFAREFFTSYSTMKSSGQVDKNTINSFSNALGQKIVNPDLVDRYKDTDVKISSSDDINSKVKYYGDVKKLFKNYQSAGIGNELSIVSNGLASQSSNGTTNSTDQYAKLSTIANAYQNFAEKIMMLDVPQSLTQYHLRIANNSNNTSISVANMGKIINDPIVGLSGLSQYQKYSDDLVKVVADLETFLLKQ